MGNANQGVLAGVKVLDFHRGYGRAAVHPALG